MRLNLATASQVASTISSMLSSRDDATYADVLLVDHDGYLLIMITKPLPFEDFSVPFATGTYWDTYSILRTRYFGPLLTSMTLLSGA